MLTVLIGRSGTGKTAELLRRLCAGGEAKRKILLVPENYSFEMERRLCGAGGDGVSMYAEVLSFTSLSSRVFAEAGGLHTPQLDRGGRLLLMHRAVHQLEGQLTVCRRPSRKASFLRSLLDTYDEMKYYCIRPEHLLQAAERSAEDGEKLRDLGLIFRTYEALTSRVASDPRDRLTRLAELLQTCGWFRDTDVYIDSFFVFTPQQQQILLQILRQADSVTVTLTGEGLQVEGGHLEFEPARRTAFALLRLAEQAGVPAQCETWTGPRRGWLPELNWLEETWCGPGARWEQPTRAVELFEGESPFEQAEFAAGKILELVRERGLRWREIGVTVRSMHGWEDELEAVFRRYGIPVNLNRMTDILQKPVLALVTSALRAVTDGYTYEDLFRYLKTGLAGVTEDECDRLENYVLLWKIRGTKWTTQTAWSWHPEGYSQPWTEAQRQEVAALDALRRRIIAPLQHLQMSEGETGLDRAQAIYAFMEEIGLRARLEEQALALKERGSLNQAEEYAQLWEILCEALGQCAWLLQEERISLPDFSQLFQLVLSQYTVGSIPVSLDRVLVGDADRMSQRDLKALLILGAEDTAFPLIAGNAGLLNEEDRALLSELGLTAGLSPTEQAEREMMLLYSLLSLPKQALVVAHSVRSGTGEEQRPSVLFTRLGAYFPQCVRTTSERCPEYRLSAPVPALDVCAELRDPSLLTLLKDTPETAARAERLDRAFRIERGHLTPQAVKTLYSDTIRLSASRMDKIRQCHFSYFMEYGLQAKKRAAAEFDAIQYGTFVHYILEHVLKAAGALGGVKACDDDTLRRLTAEALQRYVAEELGGLEDKPKRFQYLFQRLQRGVDRVVKNVAEELRRSDFEPVAFELRFGQRGDPPIVRTVGDLTLSINGVVDRVDVWQQGGRTYLRVVDYKTGTKAFDFTDVWNGLNLQMLVYLFALQEKDGLLPGMGELVPAGVLYLPAKDVTISGSPDMSDEELQKKTDAALKRHGLLLGDPDVLNAMEHHGDSFRFLPVTLKKGQPAGSYLASAEQLGQLRGHVDRILTQIGLEFGSGNVDTDPYTCGQTDACKYCAFASACHFEEGQRGNRRRYAAAISAADFWEKIERETAGTPAGGT